MTGAIGDYLEHQVSGADSGRLVVMLYERALADLSKGRELAAIFGENPPPQLEDEFVRVLVHAQTIISELNKSLDYQNGGEIAVQLGRLYEFLQYSLHQCVILRRDEGLADLMKVLDGLCDSWRQITGQGSAAGSVSLPSVPAAGSVFPANPPAAPSPPAPPAPPVSPAAGSDAGAQSSVPPAGLRSILVA